MGPEAQNLWDWIVTYFVGDDSHASWSNTAAYPHTVDEDNMDELVREVFGGYNRPIRFCNGAVQYRLKVLPLQNKFTRAQHAYRTYRGGENMVNVIAFPASGGGNVFNIHIQVRRLASAIKARKKHAASVAGPDEWISV